MSCRGRKTSTLVTTATADVDLMMAIRAPKPATADPSGAQRLSDLLLIIESLVDLGNLIAPPAPLEVIQAHDLVVGPVQIVRKKGYLLVNVVEGVARYSPGARSTLKACSHFGQTTLSWAVPFPLICLYSSWR